MGLAEPGRPSSEGLHAVVVPNMALMRARKIVNVGDILRFELEGLSAALPPHQRVLGYDISFEPLPRTTTQRIERHEVEKRARARAAQQPDAPLPAEDQAWLDEPHAAAAAPLIRARAKGARVRPDANLEIDLGFDSMERVELLTELEATFGIRVSPATAVEIFTVRQLVEAFAVRSAFAARAEIPERAATADHEGWSRILKDLPGQERSRAWLAAQAPNAGGAAHLRLDPSPAVPVLPRPRRRAREAAGVRAVHHLPQPPKLRRSVRRCAACCRTASSRICSSSARPSISKRR